MEEQNLENLSRRERRKILKEQGRVSQKRSWAIGQLGKWAIGLLGVGLLIMAGWWVYKELTKPLPGQAVEDMGEEHVTDISNVTYNSNPPTSGKHFPVWAKKGVYDRALSDGYLIHSLEHGYVILSYNCTKGISNFHTPKESRKASFPISNVFAHETEEPHEEPVGATQSGEVKPLTRMTFQPKGTMNWFTPDNPPPVEVELPDSFKSEECKSLVDELSGVMKGYDRVIVVPRIDLDTGIALTAWRRIDKMDSFDKERIKRFIDGFHNKGPEKTVE